MIQIYEERDSDFVTVRASGVVTKADVDAAVPQLERLIEERAPLRLYVDLVGLDRFEPAGLWEELKFDLGHRDDIARVAFLVNSPGEAWTGWLGGLLAGGEAQQFHIAEKASALAWLRQR